MNRTYMWLFFSITVIIIIIVWVVVFSKTIRYSLAGNENTKMRVVSDQFKEVEQKFKSFQNINKELLEARSGKLKEKVLQEAALQKMKEKLGARITN